MIYLFEFGARSDPGYNIFCKMKDKVIIAGSFNYKGDMNIMLEKYNGRFIEDDDFIVGFEFETEQDYLMFKLSI